MNSTAHPFAARQEITFVLSDLPDLNTLLSGLPIDSEVHVLDANGDALAQMAAILDGRSGLDAIHLFSHGAPGTLHLGTLTLDNGTIAAQAETLVRIGSALAENGDFLLYGCDVAQGETGRAFIEALSTATGADVAASQDLTGNAPQGGNWVLENQSGSIEAISFSLPTYEYTLATQAGTTGTWTLNNGLLRFGNGTQSSLNSAGNLLQPWYYDSVLGGGAFYKLTYSSNPLNSAIAAGGDGTTPWNLNGTILYDQLLTNWMVNDDGFVSTSGNVGYGTLISYGDMTIGTYNLQLSNRYELGQNASFVKVTTTVTNVDADNETIANLRFWTGTRDDWIGETDSPTKARGNIVDGVFTQISNAADQSKALQITDGATGVLFYSRDDVYTYIRNGFTSFNTVVAQDPAGSVISRTADDSYAMYVRMPDIVHGQSASFTWYYAAGEVSNLNSIINSLGAKLQYSVSTLTESSANIGAIATIVQISLIDDTFTGNNNDNFAGTKALVTNVPADLTAEVIRTSATTAELRITGNATNHTNAQDISTLQIAFQNNAFDSGSAASISGNTKTFNIDFIDGANGAPTGLSNLTLAAVDEDTAAPAGAAISSLAGLAFADPDSGDSLSGIAVVGNTANASTEGAWQYSTNVGTNWYAIGTVSETQALSLSAATLVRFVPVADYNGNPPALTVRALDSSANFFSVTAASETRVTLDASSNGGSSAIAATPNTISTTINPVNDAPVVTSSGTTAYTENAAATAINPALTVADIDNSALASATVSITANFQTSQDVLAFTNDSSTMGNIAGTYDATTGVLSLTSAGATATVAEWQTALRAVTYANTSDTPSTASRTVSFVVNDGALNSNTGTRSITVTAVNDVPAITNLNGDTPSGTIGSAIKLDAGTAATVTDPDSADFNDGTLTITTASGTADGNFSLDGTNAKAGAAAETANAAIAASEKVYVGATEIGTVHATNTGQAGATMTITFNASATPALVGTLLQNLSYTTSTAGARGFNVVLTDGDGGTSSTAAVTLMVNDPPAPAPDPSPAPVPPSAPTGVPTGTFDGVTITATTATSSSGATVTTVSIPVVTGTRQDDPNTVRNTHADIPLAQNSSGETVLQVSVPTGIGLTSQTFTGSGSGTGGTQTLREILIAASGPRVENTLAFAEILQQGIDTYVPGVQDQSQVTVRTITLTAPTGSTGASAPVIITGASGTGESDTAHPQRQEALVIDARALPSGTTLQLDNVEFAIVIGASRVLGGSGRNFAVGDDAVQFIVMGEDDDVLRGGGGDDTVGSKGGDDILYGDAGNDRLVGGIGDDTLYGGDGDDILQGGASDAGSWIFGLDAQGQIQLRFSTAEPDLAATSDFTFSLAHGWYQPGMARGQYDSRAALIEQDYGVLEEVALLYRAVTGQRPEAALLSGIAGLGLNDRELAQGAYDYFVAQTPGVQSQAIHMQVRALIAHVWGSSAADDALVAGGTQYLENGGSWAEGLLYLAHHANNRDQLLDTQGMLQLTRALSLGETGWSPNAGNDRLYGGAGNDLLLGSSGNNVLDGGAGIDMLAVTGVLADYTLGLKQGAQGAETVLRSVHTGEENVLIDIEFGRVGGEIYTLFSGVPGVEVGEFRPLADFVRLVGTAELQALGVPGSWLG